MYGYPSSGIILQVLLIRCRWDSFHATMLKVESDWLPYILPMHTDGLPML